VYLYWQPNEAVVQLSSSQIRLCHVQAIPPGHWVVLCSFPSVSLCCQSRPCASRRFYVIHTHEACRICVIEFMRSQEPMYLSNGHPAAVMQDACMVLLSLHTPPLFLCVSLRVFLQAQEHNICLLFSRAQLHKHDICICLSTHLHLFGYHHTDQSCLLFSQCRHTVHYILSGGTQFIA
jgi:hypothetical protein